MKKIKLSQGKYAIVDNDDYVLLSKYRWHWSKRGYALRKVHGKAIFMHRVINKTPNGLLTDHINRNKIDNRKINLRTCNKSQNTINRDNRPDNKSGCSGVYIYYPKEYRQKNWRPSWMAKIWKNGKTIHLGYYKTKKDAVKARIDCARKLYGEFFPIY